MDDSLPKIQIVKKSAAQALSDLKNNPPGGPMPSATKIGKEIAKEVPGAISEVPTAPELPPEIKEHGVETVTETIELPPEMKKAGVEVTGEPYQLPEEKVVAKIPLTTQQMQQGLHRASPVDALLWLIHWCIRQIKIGKRGER